MNELYSKNQNMIRNMVLAAMFLAIGIILPTITGGIPQIGNLLLPMHIPVLLCGLICGWQYGLIAGFITPLLRGAIFGMLMFYPTGLAMAFELATYGAVIGFLYARFRKQNVFAVYVSLITAMIVGRVGWGVVRVIMMGVGGSAFTWQMFIAGAFLNAIPGIILQLVLIPVLMTALNRAGLVRFENRD
ncbi:MAG: ECF transporter S component [Lachnospiraceae bacterium]|nr:ECF transporter S component [Lachnospiraceae bacterium]